MKKYLSIIVITMFIAPATHAVDLSRTVVVPQIEGLTVPEIPSEITSTNKSQSYTLSIKTPQLDDLLKEASLPAVCQREVITREIPQCRVSQITRSATYELIGSDREWRHKQSWWCRLSRKLFGSCNPESVQDILSLSLRLNRASEEKTDIRQSSILALPATKCVSQESTAEDKMLDALSTCGTTGTPYDEDCVRLFQGQKLNKRHKLREWVATLSPSSTRTVREILPSLPESSTVETKLLTVSLGALSLQPKPVELWTTSFSNSYDFINAFSQSGGTPISLTGKYQRTVNGQVQPSYELSGQVNVENHSATVENFPSEVRLKLSDILKFNEEYLDVDKKAEEILKICRINYSGQNSQNRSICDELKNSTKWARKPHFTFSFVDQMGNSRRLSWEGHGSIEKCTVNHYGYSYQDSFYCPSPDVDPKEWGYDKDAKKILRFLVDSESCCSDLIFGDLLSYVPHEEDPSKDVQSRSVSIRYRE